MKAAGLTHGGIYGHFASKDDLIAESLAHMLTASLAGSRDFERFADGYLSEAHRSIHRPGARRPRSPRDGASRPRGAGGDDRGSEGAAGPHGGLGTSHGSGRRAPRGDRPLSAMVGAVILARACDDPALSTNCCARPRLDRREPEPHDPLIPGAARMKAFAIERYGKTNSPLSAARSARAAAQGLRRPGSDRGGRPQRLDSKIRTARSRRSCPTGCR